MTPPDLSNWTCPLPLRDHAVIVMGHGGGGRLTAELVDHVFRPAFADPALDRLGDSSVLPQPGGRIAMTTDCHVVRPLFFPGGSLGELAVHGTVNDLAMSGARPLYLTAGFILEEGLPLAALGELVRRMAAAARAAGVRVVAGDTKVVERGHGDGCFITTAGVGVVPNGVDVGPDRARPGDVVVLSGTIGEHGMAVMSVREGLAFESEIVSDSAPLHELVERILASTTAVHAFRDPTRGGVAAALHEIAAASRVGITLDEESIPVRPEVQAACEMLGLDALQVANEGKMLAVVPRDAADNVLAAMRSHPAGREARVIGTVDDKRPGMLAVRTPFGGTRVVPLQLGEQLPRIC